MDNFLWTYGQLEIDDPKANAAFKTSSLQQNPQHHTLGKLQLEHFGIVKSAFLLTVVLISGNSHNWPQPAIVTKLNLNYIMLYHTMVVGIYLGAH